MKDDEQCPLENNIVCQTHFDPDKMYIITGGLGGLGKIPFMLPFPKFKYFVHLIDYKAALLSLIFWYLI